MKIKVRLILIFCFTFIGMTMYHHINDKKEIVEGKELIILTQNNSNQKKLTYDQYMKLGYEAENKGEYEKALNNFTLALKLRPNDAYSKTAIRNVKTYTYDNYMEKGYTASNNKDYVNALNYFKKASESRPNDFYARQAQKNVQIFAQRDSTSGNNNPSVQNNPSNNNLLLIIIFFMIMISAGLILVIIRLFQVKSSEIKAEISDDISTETPKNITSESSLNLLSEETNEVPEFERNSSQGKENQNQSSDLVSVNNKSSLNNTDEIRELLSNLEQEDSKQRRKIIWNLAQKGDSRAVKPLVKMMINADSYERSLILEALSQISTASMKPMNQALLLSLQDENPQVRKNAIRDLTKIYDLMNQIHPLINHTAQNDPDNEVREIANWALQKFSFKDKSLQLQGNEKEVNATLITDDSE